MMKLKLFNIKYLAVLTALAILIVSLCCYNTFETNAGLSQRIYLRYDYTNPNSSAYQYTLSVPETNFNDVQSYSIFPPNNMVRDYNTSVVRISTGGTGFIIGQNTIVTAAHCVYNNGLLNFDVKIVGDTNQILDTITPHYVHVPKKYVDSASDKNNYDYALIYVDQDLSEYGMFGMGICLDSYVNNQGSVIVSGFPQEYPPGYENSGYGIRFKAAGNITSKSSDGLRLTYNADTAGGDSGGPVFVNESFVGTINNFNVSYDCNTVIAIHTHSGNSGVRINFDILYFCYQNSNLTAT